MNEILKSILFGLLAFTVVLMTDGIIKDGRRTVKEVSFFNIFFYVAYISILFYLIKY